MPLTPRSLILSTLRGDDTAGRIPWNCYGWLLPDNRVSSGLLARGLSRMETRTLFKTHYQDGIEVAETRYIRHGEVHYHLNITTPAGTLTEESRLDSSYGSRWITKYLISSPADFAPALEYLRAARFEPDYSPWAASECLVGDAGFTIGEIMPIPVMKLIVSYMGVENFLVALTDTPDALDELLTVLDTHYDRQIEIAAASPAEIIWFGDNVTASIISPRQYGRFIAPVYDRVMPILNAAGKIPIAHYDGSNKPLVNHIARTPLPVIEAFTPPPMGDLTVTEARAAWADKVIWVNFPGSLFIQPYEVIRAYADVLVREGAAAGRFILGCTEDFPLTEFEKTFTAIGDALEEYHSENGISSLSLSF